jgi:hypothetical protein
MRFWFAVAVLFFAGRCAPRAASDVSSPSIQVDPNFGYYLDRSPATIAAELKVNGWRNVRYLVTRDNAASAALVAACHDAGLTVWYGTLGNGTYDTRDLPAGGEPWRMRLRDAPAAAGGFVYLCMNHPDYRRWKKAQVVATLKKIPFDGFEIAESFWPAFDGPDNPRYGCLCDHCRAAFRREFPGAKDIPNFTDPKDPNYYRTRRELYAQWIEFRAASAVAFLDDIINGPGGVRANFPNLKVAVWGIADAIPDAVVKLKEWEGTDAALLDTRIKPDLLVLQTDWPDWSKPDLEPGYALQYRPFVEAIRAAGSAVPIQLQTDIGSHENCRRGRDWMNQCEAAARRAGMIGIVSYEYHLSRDLYEAPPEPLLASGRGNFVTLTFNKRLDAASAAALSHYAVAPGRVVAAKSDGNIVQLEVAGRPSRVTVSDLADDPGRRLFKNHPAVKMPAPVSLPIRWPEK